MTTPTTTRGRTAVDWLRRQPKRNLLVLALLPVLVMLWLPLLSGGSKAAPSALAAGPLPSPPSAPLAEMATPAADALDLPAVTRLSDRIEALMVPYEPRWQPTREPTRPGNPSPSASPASNNTTKGSVADLESDDEQLVPSTILISPGRPPIAIVRGRSYRVGDAVHGHTVIAIAEQHMLYRSGSDTVAVRLPAPRLGDKQ